MSAESLVQIAEERGLIDARTANKLRKQLAAKPDVPAEKVAKLLVQREKITKGQAKSLLELVTAPAEDDGSSSDLGLAVSDSSPALQAVEEVEPEAPTAQSGPESGVGLAAIDDLDAEVGLQPLKEDGLTPLDDHGLAPLDDDGLTPLDDHGLTPLDDHGLTPLDEPLVGEGLTPLDVDPLSDGLTPLDESSAVGGIAKPFPGEGGTSLEESEAAASTEPSESRLDDIDGEVATAPATRKKKKKGLFGGVFARSSTPKIRKNRWDSPLLLLGGGGLVLLSLVGFLLYYVLTRGTGDEYFGLAEEDYASSSYSQAIYKYEAYLSKFPKHPQVSLARCRIGLSKMRQAVESGDWQRSLQTSDENLLAMKTEAAFPEIMPELRGILPEIYEGFVEQAKSNEAISEKEQLLQQAKEALALVDNPEFLPTSQRKSLQPRIDKIAKDVVLIDREIYRDRELQKTIQQIHDAAGEGQTAEAYGFRKELLSRYPELTTNAPLRDAVLKITAAEVERVQLQPSGLQPSTTDDRPGPSRTVVLADRVQNADAPLVDEVVFVHAQGAIYGLQGANGELLWRRWVGFESQLPAVPVATVAGADALVIDDRSRELLRLEARTGKLVWRLGLGEPAAGLSIQGGRGLLVLQSGKLLVVDLATGSAERHLQFPQRLLCLPAVDASQGLLYQPGEHSSLYVCDVDSMACRQVYYVGHKPGAITVPPALTNGYIFLAESGGTQYATLHVLKADADGKLMPVLDPIRLDGSVSRPMMVSGNRIIIITDLGAVYVFVADPSMSDQPVRIIARMLRTTAEL